MTLIDQQGAVDVRADPDQLLYDAEQTSELIGFDSNGKPHITAYWLKRKAAKGLIPCTYVAGKPRWSRKNIADLLEQLAKGPGALLCASCLKRR